MVEMNVRLKDLLCIMNENWGYFSKMICTFSSALPINEISPDLLIAWDSPDFPKISQNKIQFSNGRPYE